LLVSFTLPSCQNQSTETQSSDLKVVATNSLVGDVVSQVGGNKISVQILLPLGTDPHSFAPTPRDASNIVDASLVFANGVGLENSLNR
jgi:ABC-type Zn uptake system ZnuABC Zn-binding protein ZnuA